MAIKDVAERAGAYGMPSKIVDGMDAMAVFEATESALVSVRAGEGPYFLECKTYRYYNHHGIQNLGLSYRTDEEVEEWKGRDAIDAIEARMVADGVASEAEVEANRASIQAEVDEAIDFADSSPMPDPADLLDNVYSDAVSSDAVSSDAVNSEVRS